MSSEDLPLCARRSFLYPGEPEGTGIIAYETSIYRNEFDGIDFIDSSQFIHSLENDLTLRDRSLLEVADGEQFEIPEYQRNYSWGIEQHKEMWETIRQVLQFKSQAGEKPSDTFFGSIYIAKSPKNDRYEIIDGQQRVATVAIILHIIGEKIDNHYESVGGDLKRYASHVRNDIISELLFRKEGPSDVPFLSLNEHDDNWFRLLFKHDYEKIEMVRDMNKYDGRKKNAESLVDLMEKIGISHEIYKDIIPDEEMQEFRYFGDAHSKLIKAYQYYSKRIESLISRDSFDDSKPKVRILINLTQFLLRSLRVSECLFETDDQELRIRVFQSLNDRGIELSKMDKIRARIVGRFQGAEDSDKQIGRWEDVMREFGTDAKSVEDFLAHYLAATEEEFKKVSQARTNMLEAFRLRDTQNNEVKSRLASKGEARDFLEELRAYAHRYQEIINANLTEDTEKLEQNHRRRAEAILRRLNSLGTKSWRPFVMYVYQQVIETPDKGKFFHKILQSVESIMFRFIISPHQSTVIDDTYPITTQYFIELERSGSQFNVEDITEKLKQNVDDDAQQMFGEEFVSHLISTTGWRDNRLKQILIKIVDESQQKRNEDGIMNISLSQDTKHVHIEHVLPKSFIDRQKHSPYAWLENFFTQNGQNVLQETIELLKREDMHRLSPESDRYSDLEPIIERIRDSFTRDIGNVMLLEENVNRSIQNSLFSKKIKSYHQEHPDDMNNVANEFFTSSGEISGSKLKKLQNTDIPSDESINGVASIIEDFNSWWCIEMLIRRKKELIEMFLKSLEIPTGNNEFNDVYGNIEQMIENDYNTRVTLAKV